jgi:aspartyl-tRNA(Asn)/glutamyl-tRNA(Gln) amidotransferase subunit C
MHIDSEALHKIAHLARLEVGPDEEAALLDSLSSVLTWMEQLNELDTSAVEPLTHLTEGTNVLREDEAQETLSTAQALTNAPSQDGTYVRVPKVLE